MTCELVGVLAGRKYEGPFHPRRDTGVIRCPAGLLSSFAINTKTIEAPF
jgi:hypothetical protein